MHCGIKKASTLVKRSMFLSQNSTKALLIYLEIVLSHLVKNNFRLKSAMFLRTPFCQKHDLQIYNRAQWFLS